MTEIEQLRKEINELRERIATLEARPAVAPPRIDWNHQSPLKTPQWINPNDFPYGTVIY